MARAIHRGLDLFPWLLVIILVTSALWRCGDQGGSSPAENDTGAADANGDGGGDVSGDPVIDPAEEAQGDAVADGDAGPQCFGDDRVVGDRCAAPTDRVCLTNGDCRPTETCEFAGDEATGTCIYHIPPPIDCPGGPTCPSGDPAPLRAGFAMRPITPQGYEEPRPDFMDSDGYFTGDPEDPDTFFDCGRDMVCPGDAGYTGPDADGSEGDGVMQGVWMAGLNESFPALRCPDELLGDGCTAGPDCCANRLAHDDIWARGVIFEQGDSKVAIVTLDLIGYFYSDIQRIRAALPESLGIDELIVSSTHVHEGPDTMGLWGPGFGGSDLPVQTGVDPDHMRTIQSQVIALLEEANDHLADVDLYAAQMHTGVHDVAGNDTRDPWIFDDTLAAVQVVKAGTDRSDPANTVGVLVNWGNHPESVGGDNHHISADFPHYVRQYIEDGLPAVTAGDVELPAIPGLHAPVIYLSRTLGGLTTPLHTQAVARDGTVVSDNGFAKADAMGQRLAEDTLGLLADAPQVTGTLSFGLREMLIGVPNLRFHIAIFALDLFPNREIYNWRHSDGFTPENPPKLLTAVARVQIGGLSFATVPGEIFPETVVGGFHEGDSQAQPVRGDPHDTRCGTDLLPLAEGSGEGTNPCLIDPDNPNPPDLDAAPTGGFLADELPGEVLFLVGLGMDEIGYLVPAYDFKLDPDAPYVAEAPGDHYEETNSVGGPMLRTILDEMQTLWGVDHLFEGP